MTNLDIRQMLVGHLACAMVHKYSSAHTMVSAAQDGSLALFRLLLVEDWVGSVSTHIMESLNVSLSVLDQEVIEASRLKPQKAAGLWQTEAVGDQQPALREDCAALELVESGTVIPGSGQIAFHCRRLRKTAGMPVGGGSRGRLHCCSSHGQL